MSGRRVLSRVGREEVVRRLKSFKERAVRVCPNITQVILVGSVALNTHTARSDVDVVVIYRGREPDYARLKEILSECVKLPADLILIEERRVTRLSPKVRDEWFRKGIII